MGPRLAIFDFDGTIADSAAWFFGTVNEVARQFGFREVTAEEGEMLRGRPTRDIIAYLGVPLWKLPLIASHMRGLARRDVDRIRPFPWVPDAFQSLGRAGVVIAIVSSNDEANIARVLGPTTMTAVAALVTGASLFGKPRKFREAMRRTGIPAERAVAVGDEVRDIEAARQAGIGSIAVGWGYATRTALAAANPTRLVDHPDALLAALLGGDGPLGAEHE